MRGWGLLLGMVVWFLPVCGWTASPYEAVRRGNVLYQDGQYEEAARQYGQAAEKLPETPEIAFNQGNAFYKRGDYAKALEHYSRALLTSDPALESRVKYNLGNARYQQALQTLQNPQEATTHVRSAMTYYRDSLDIDAQQQKALYNLELAHRLLRQLQQQQQQSQQNQQSQPDENDQQNQKRQNQAQQDQSNQQDQQNQTQQDQEGQQQHARHQNESQQPQEQQAAQSSRDEAAAENTDTQQAAAPHEMTPEDAERLLEIIRERAREADAQRQQRRRARMRGTRVDKDW